MVHKYEKIIDRVFQIVIFAVLFYSGVILVQAFLQGYDIGAWIWDRHQNLFSWYSRPLFIIPACYYAYRRKMAYVIALIFVFVTSLFWFPAPEVVPESVAGYLDWEKSFFYGSENLLNLFALAVAVAVFLISLFYAFWKRNAWYGLLVINIGTLLKVVVSLVLDQESGTAAVLPSLSSLVVINLVAFFVWRHFSSKKSHS